MTLGEDVDDALFGSRMLLPFIGTVTPLTIPFFEAPRIPYHQKLLLLKHTDINFDSSNQRVGMSIHQPRLLDSPELNFSDELLSLATDVVITNPFLSAFSISAQSLSGFQ